MADVTLGSIEFKALSSDTRTHIIKLLDERNYTLSEISKKLELSAPTIKQHLEILENSGMVIQLDSGHKWKYYMLTKKGKILIKGEETTHILIVIGASFVLLAFLLFGLLGTLSLSSMSAQAPMFTGSDFEESFAVSGSTEQALATIADEDAELGKNTESESYTPRKENTDLMIEETPQLKFNEILSTIAMIIVISAIMGYMFGLLHVKIKKKRLEF